MRRCRCSSACSAGSGPSTCGCSPPRARRRGRATWSATVEGRRADAARRRAARAEPPAAPVRASRRSPGAYVERAAGDAGSSCATRARRCPACACWRSTRCAPGGGTNHRMALDDAILVKDNHLTLGGGDFDAAVRARAHAVPGLPLEVECRTLAEVERAVAAAPDLILLDNMSLDDLAAAVATRRRPRPARGVGRHHARASSRPWPPPACSTSRSARSRIRRRRRT